jgi:hypothetical protein
MTADNGKIGKAGTPSANLEQVGCEFLELRQSDATSSLAKLHLQLSLGHKKRSALYVERNVPGLQSADEGMNLPPMVFKASSIN